MCLMSEFGPTDPGERLARRTTNKNVHLLVHGARNAQVSKNRCWRLRGYISWFEMSFPVFSAADSGKIGSMRVGSPRVRFNRTHEFKPCGRKPECNAAAAGKQIHEPRRAA